MHHKIRPNVMRMHPYSPGKPIEEVQRELGLSEIIKLASNENPLGPPPKAVEAIRRAADQMHLYPDSSGFSLRAALAERFSMDVESVVLGSGSDELIHILGQVFLGREEDEVIAGDPSFVRYYATAYLAPSKLIRVPLDSEMRHDLPAMAKSVNENTKLIFIANPNNPTGTIVRRNELAAFLKDIPRDIPLVLDEAYYEFAAEDQDYPNSLEFIRQGYSVIGLRTFSKTYGLAGARIGYLFATPEVANAMHRARAPFNVSSLAQAAAIAALDDEDHLQKTIENNRRGLERLSRAFIEAGARPVESFTNFVFADLGKPARPVYEELLQRGIIVRSGEVLGMPNYLRVSVGTEAEMDAFVREFRSVMKSESLV